MCGAGKQEFWASARKAPSASIRSTDIWIHQHFQESKELFVSTHRHGDHRSDSGGSGCSLPEASLEDCAQAGSLVTVCGQHHHGFVHLRHCYPDYELWEKPPGTKVETKRKLAAMALPKTWAQPRLSRAKMNKTLFFLPQLKCVSSTHLNSELRGCRSGLLQRHIFTKKTI